MSNIIKQKEDLLILKDFIKQIDEKTVSTDDLKQIVKLLLPKNNEKTLITYSIRNYPEPAFFNPIIREVCFSPKLLESWIAKTTKAITEKYDIKDNGMLRNYLYVYAILHEIEHSYQLLMAKGIIEAPNPVIKNGYKGIFELNTHQKNPIKHIRNKISTHIYKTNCSRYILERNAKIEGTDGLIQCALATDREDMYNFFTDQKNRFTTIGYKQDTRGSLEITYDEILMYDKYKKFIEEVDCSEEEKANLGLNISEETRQKILSLTSHQSKNY